MEILSLPCFSDFRGKGGYTSLSPGGRPSSTVLYPGPPSSSLRPPTPPFSSARERNVPEKYIRLVQDMYMYRGCKTVVRSEAGESNIFGVEVGLRQG